MKQAFPPHRRALAALVPTLALLAVPAVAQDQTAPVVAPPIVQTAPAPAAPAQAAPVQAAPVQTVQTAPVEAPPAADAPEERAPRATRAPAPTRSVAQRATSTSTSTHTTKAPVAAPVETPSPAPAPVAAAPETTPVVTPAPVAQTSSATTTETKPVTPAPTESTGFNWASPWLALIGVGLIALIGFIMMGRRRRADAYETYDEPVAYEEPVRAPAPVIAEPIVAAAPVARADAQFLRRETPVAAQPEVLDEASNAAGVVGEGELVAADDTDVEALTAGNPPVADRPWLEMAMRPLRAGTNVDEAVVEIELTVGNSGSVAADDVRISTFMFDGAPVDNEMERLLIERDADGDALTVRIKPGEGQTLEATLALPRSALNGSVSPVIVADARYSLPGGGEGRTAASFRISVSDDGETMTPIPTDRAHMFDVVSAELHGVPEHA